MATSRQPDVRVSYSERQKIIKKINQESNAPKPKPKGNWNESKVKRDSKGRFA